MNKQELIDKLKNDLTVMSEIKGKKYEYDKGYERAIKEHLTMITALDWPEKPVVPQFVAEYIDSEQNSYSTLSEAIDNMDDERRILDWFYVNSETFAKAWLYGYEVEKDKLYTVEIPNQNGDGYGVVYLGINEDNKIELRIWDCFSSIEFSNNWKQFDNAQLTEDEIKKDYKWAWQFAEEVDE